jgi:transcriptional regulator with XRE-family HTH domain
VGRRESQINPNLRYAGFAEELRKLRIRAGLRQIDIVKAATDLKLKESRSESTISRAFKGEYLPSWETTRLVVRICNANEDEWLERWAAENLRETGLTGDGQDTAPPPSIAVAKLAPVPPSAHNSPFLTEDSRRRDWPIFFRRLPDNILPAQRSLAIAIRMMLQASPFRTPSDVAAALKPRRSAWHIAELADATKRADREVLLREVVEVCNLPKWPWHRMERSLRELEAAEYAMEEAWAAARGSSQSRGASEPPATATEQPRHRGGRPLKPIHPNNPYAAFALELRKLVASTDMPTWEIARRSHLSTATVSRAMNGNTLPSWEVTRAIVRGCRADELSWQRRWDYAKRPVDGIHDLHTLTRLADAGNPNAAGKIAQLADAGDENAARRRADLLGDRGDLDALARLADAGDRNAVRRRADLLYANGDREALTQLTDAGDKYAANRLVDLLCRDGDRKALSQLADAGDQHAARTLVNLLYRDGDREALAQLADAGNRHAAMRLVDLLDKDGDRDALTQRADAGDRYAVATLVNRHVDDLAERRDLNALAQLADDGNRRAAIKFVDVSNKNLAERERAASNARALPSPRVAKRDRQDNDETQPADRTVD